MNFNTPLPIKKLYIILITCSVIIFASSLDVMVTVKDISKFKEWLQINQLVGEQSDLLGSFVALNLSLFFFKIIIPVTFALYSYCAYLKLKINALFVFMWTVLNIGGLAYIAVELRLDSVLYYIIIFAYVINILTTISLAEDIRENNSK